MAPVRLAFVGDIHHGRDTFTKKGTAALPLLDRFLDEVGRGDFDAVIELGDRISDEDAEGDRGLLQDVAARFVKLRRPRHHVSGNHDHAMLSPRENEALLDAPLGCRVVEIGAVRVVFWQPDVMLTRERGFRLGEGDLSRLERLLAQDERPTLLVSHVPLSGHAQTGNYYFERNPGHATYAEVGDIRRVIAAAPCPIVAMAGHVHWNTLTVVDGTPHITLQSLTETFTTGAPAGSTGVLEIDGEVMRWTVAGLDPFAVVLPWPRAKRRWTAPLPRFDAAVEDPVKVAARVPETA